MDADAVREFTEHEPFLPFRLTLAGGDHLDIVRPHTAVVAGRQLFVALPDGNGKFLSLDKITSAEWLPPTPAARTAVTKQSLRARLDRRPFEPFRVNTADGKRFDITDPHLVVATEKRLFIVFERPEGWVGVALGQITGVDVIRAA